MCSIEIKSGKDYKRHRALENVLGDANYEIGKAFIFSDQNTQRDGRKCYLPIYLLMFVEETKLSDAVYKIDLRGL